MIQVNIGNFVIQNLISASLDINLWLVDHVCMAEGGGKGHMCFCEHDDCNGVKKLKYNSLNFLVLLIFVFMNKF